MGDSVVLEIGGTEVSVSHPDKVFFSKRGETKLDLIRYYQAVAEPLLGTLQGRPLLLERYPDGASGKSFFQKRVPKSAPPWLRTTVVSTPNGTTSDALVAADLAHIAWAVNLGCLGFHVWPYHADAPEVTDELRIDLDPSPGVTFPQVVETAQLTRQLLGEYGIGAQVKTSGSRGLHVYSSLLPRWNSYEVRAAAVALARELERRRPDLITAKWWKEERGSRVFVDYNQNAPHKTVFGAWCVRPRVGGQVSTPISWDELGTVEPDSLTIATVPDRLAALGDPWAGRQPQSIEPLLEQSARDMASGLQDAPWPPVYPKQPNEPPRVAPSRAKRN
ncbi:non-homologous end-joining DNA ligase [Saccharopolyspora sp. NPDC002376]